MEWSGERALLLAMALLPCKQASGLTELALALEEPAAELAAGREVKHDSLCGCVGVVDRWRGSVGQSAAGMRRGQGGRKSLMASVGGVVGTGEGGAESTCVCMCPSATHCSATAPTQTAKPKKKPTHHSTNPSPKQGQRAAAGCAPPACWPQPFAQPLRRFRSISPVLRGSRFGAAPRAPAAAPDTSR